MNRKLENHAATASAWATDQLLEDLRDIYNIDGVRLREKYNASCIRVLKDGGIATSDYNPDRVNIYVTIYNQVYCIDRG
jgi:hypothetical protein|tara:strand:+ start:1305 stop:1541 length:237 start_codon:yes stop_codon:yes gene_type:complete